MEMNVEKPENLEANNASTYYDRSKTAGECGIF
jgi:hypothetical protein